MIIYSLPVLFLGYVLLVRGGHIGGFQYNEPFELIDDMDHSSRIRSQSKSIFFADSTIERKEIENTYPVFSHKYHLNQLQYKIADSIYNNPLKKSKKVISIGKHLFNSYCFYCHGHKGKADGPVIKDVQLAEDEEGFPPPPDLTEGRTVELSDARIFHILSAGQNLMFSYDDRLSEKERWALIHYIRKLQDDAKEK